jgi:protein-S-isoprenylcysteine O-methyltransferase Ste14
MPLAHIVLCACYVSLLLELTVLAVPSVASTWHLMQGRPNRRWAARRLVPAVLAVGAFALPGVLCVVPAWHACLVPLAAQSPWLDGAAIVLALGGRALTLWAVAALRRPRTARDVVAHGPYARCRNPALLGLHLFLAAGALAFPNVANSLGWIWFVGHMHGRVLLEEQHLSAVSGADYSAYLRRVPRYVPAHRRRVPP